MTAQIIARMPTTYRCADGTTTHAPLIVTSVGGAAPARYILDTGSEVHLLNEDLVDELELTKTPGEEGVDHAGNTMPSWSVGEVGINIGDYAGLLRDCVSIPAPDAFTQKGFRGAVSPQALHPDAWIVMDMANDELLLVGGANDDVADFLRARTPALELLTLTRDPGYPTLVVPAALEGFDEIPTLLNTGGKSTEYGAEAVAGMAQGAEERLGAGVGGGDYVGWAVGEHNLLVGGRKLSLPKVSVRPQMHDTQAIVGMDALRGTVLAFAHELSKPVFWLVPA